MDLKLLIKMKFLYKKPREIDIEGMPKYTLKTSKRIKNISLTINENGELIAKAPNKKYENLVLHMIKSKKQKIEEIMTHRKTEKKILESKVNGDFKILDHSLAIKENKKIDKIVVTKKDKEYTLEYPCEYKNLLRESISNNIKEILTEISKKDLISELNRISKESSLSYNKASIKDVSTIWGSCNKENNITLSTKLALVDKDLVSYVIAHELAHTVHKNHKKEFWLLVDKIIGRDAKSFNKKLSCFSHPLRIFLK